MLFFVANILIIYYSFYEFYKKSYRKKSNLQEEASSAKVKTHWISISASFSF